MQSVNSIVYLLQNSGLPGPRANLSLLYSFAHSATEEDVRTCLSYFRHDLSNSPEEFVVVCGIVAYCVLNEQDITNTLKEIRPYASHRSWRIREAVAIGIQEIAGPNMAEILALLGEWLSGNDLEKRTVVAALCEPKLLKWKSSNITIMHFLTRLTLEFGKNEDKLSDNQNTLRKTLGYGWSVLIAAIPEEGKQSFEAMAFINNKHVQWIVRENLKKKRLEVMDRSWVEMMKTQIQS